MNSLHTFRYVYLLKKSCTIMNTASQPAPWQDPAIGGERNDSL